MIKKTNESLPITSLANKPVIVNDKGVILNWIFGVELLVGGRPVSVEEI